MLLWLYTAPPEPVLFLANIFNIFIVSLFIVWLNKLTFRFEIGFYISDFESILETTNSETLERGGRVKSPTPPDSTTYSRIRKKESIHDISP